MSPLRFLLLSEVLALHARAIATHGGTPGIRDEGLLASALAAPANRAHYEGVGVVECAATYAYHLTRNHPFIDGNKRTGLAGAGVFLRLNGFRIRATEDDLVRVFLALADGSLSRDEVEGLFAAWVVAMA